MDVPEVDPELFVKCRLCLDNTGTYQINPTMQEQIKFCFDIEVGLFDSLPQLICKTCSSTLTNFSNIKNVFIEKQKTLKDTKSNRKIIEAKEDANLPQQATVSSSQEEEIEYDNSDTRESKNISESQRPSLRKRKNTTESNVSEIDLSKNSKQNLDKSKADKERAVMKIADYRKRYVCTLCNKKCTKKSSMMKHYDKKHKKIISNHLDVFNRYCVVNLNKVDCGSTFLGDTNTVVHHRTKIVTQEPNDKMFYYIIYSPKKSNSEENSADEDTEDEIIPKRSHKRIRLLSVSSNDTVVLDEENSQILSDSEINSKIKNTPTIIGECINIDSSDSESGDMNISNLSNNITLKPNLMDSKKLQKIVNDCTNKYITKIESNENELSTLHETQLKSKILSLGTKIINKCSFSCIGLLRYIEHKHLEISWKPSNYDKETLSRIKFKLRGTDKDNDNATWNYIPDTELKTPTHKKNDTKIQFKVSTTTNNNKNVGWNELPNPEQKPTVDENNEYVSKLTSTSSVNTNLPVVIEARTLIDTDGVGCEAESKSRDLAVLYSETSKLLNANPVANPKQLPKKNNMLDINTKPAIVREETPQLCMPIITSTTSLAEPNPKDNEPKPNDDLNDNVQKSFPRIKVKPVSELMPERSTQNNPDNSWNNYQSNAIPMNGMFYVSQQNSGVQLLKQLPVTGVPLSNVTVVSSPVVSSYRPLAPKQQENTESDNGEYVILHTPELPNVRTRSPFNYLRQLLSIHNIILLDSKEPVPNNFTCLIKFKLQYSQDAAKPVVLNITFLCTVNQFYLSVKHGGEEKNMDIEKLSPNWQWEILKKINRDEVVNKILKNAESISTTTYNNTNIFFNLIKSIEFKMS